MKIDNEFKSLIPPLTDEEREELEKSILAEGCRDALILWGEILVDGHNRVEICERHGIPYRTVQMEFANREDVMAWIITNQFARRNLDAMQRSRLALKKKGIAARQANERQKAAGGNRGNQHTHKSNISAVSQNSDEAAKTKKTSSRTDQQIADEAGVSRDTIRKVEIIDAHAPKPVIKAVEGNVISINKGYELTKAAKAQPELKKKLDAAEPAIINRLFAEEIQLGRDDARRQGQIKDLWVKISTLDYDDAVYDLWLSDMDETRIKRLEEIVDDAAKNVLAIQKRFHEILNERRRLRLIT